MIELPLEKFKRHVCACLRKLTTSTDSWSVTMPIGDAATTVVVDLDALDAPTWIDGQEHLCAAYIFSATAEIGINNIVLSGAGRIWTFNLNGTTDVTTHELQLRFEHEDV